MDEIADRLHLRPSALDIPELAPCEIGQKVGLAISAALQERQNIKRHIVHRRDVSVHVDNVMTAIALVDAIEIEVYAPRLRVETAQNVALRVGKRAHGNRLRHTKIPLA